MIDIKKVISILLVLCVLISAIPYTAFALSWDGSSVTGSSATGSASDPGYAIRTDSDNCIGYRFSCVKSDGSMKVSKVIDVYRNTGYGKLGYSDGYKFTTKYNKKQLISRKGNSFATSANTTNCYKEADISFTTALPAPSGMGTWQKYNGNINQILSRLGIGSVSNLNYGDKVIVEPIYDLCLRSTYHSVTVTEYAIYGRYLLGGSSTGGSSATSNTWGYISRFTNKEFPNELYTPNGQGLWTAATKLTSKETFDNLISMGYGVGIAYTETTNKIYKIKFNGNGSTRGSMSDLSMVYGTAKKLTANAFTKRGHEFVNWNRKADGSGTSYSNRQSVNNLTSTNGATVNLYAQWNPYVLKVYYDANGGSIASSDTYKLNSEGRVYKKSDNTQFYQSWPYNKTKENGLANVSTFGIARTGYIFNGWWCTTADGVGQIIDQNDATIKPTDINPDIVSGDCSRRMYAQWNPIKYTIAFNGNGHTSGSTAAMICTYDVASNLTANGFTKTGYHFVGWNTKADGSGTTYTNRQSVLNLSATNGATITLYAQWETNAYSIGFDGNGHTGGSTSGMTMKFDESKALTANGYTKTGYTFKNWNTKANGTGASYSNRQTVSNLTTTNGGTVTLYAQWTPITYKIVFNGNGNTSGSTSYMAMTYDVAANLTANGFIKTGYVFTGWKTKADGSGTRYTNRQAVINLTATDGDVINLYAQWRPITYTIRFDGNGATKGSTKTMEMIYDQAKNLSPNGFTRTSYNFLGWNTRADGSGTSYTGKQTVKNLTNTDGATITLYAQWEYDPELVVEQCSVYQGTKSDKTTLFGYTKGNVFDDYVYKTDYPTIGDTVWYNIHFLAEAENFTARQYVRYKGGSWTTRDVTLSSSNTSSQYFPIQFTGNYKKIIAGQQYFEIEAKTDWIDSSGNVKKSGTVKTFYIPIKPVVHRTQVQATGYEGSVVAYNSSVGSRGKLYSGQHIKIAYKYMADNTWSATEYLRGSMYHYDGSKWASVYTSNGGYDAAKNKASISKASPITLNSSIGTYTVPVTSQNKLRFKLNTWWFSDKTNTLEETWYDLPVVKADVALSKITLIDSSTNATLDPNNLKAGQNILVRYTYKNNTDTKVYVEGFKNDKIQISGVYAIPAKSSITVEGYRFVVPNKRSISIWGGVYLEGMGIYNTDYESNGSNNASTLNCKVNHPLTLQPITPNADYRENTEVITSYWLKNSYSDDYTPAEDVSIKFCVYKGSNLIYSWTKSKVVVPGDEYNLIYFKWTVPTGLSSVDVKITGEIIDDGSSYNKITKNYSTTPYLKVQTPDTQFEKRAPSGFTIPDDNSVTGTACEWWEYIYENGRFVKKAYYTELENNTLKIEPENTQIASKNGSVWYMNSGYGIIMSLKNGVGTTKSGYYAAPANSYTLPQYGVAHFPEYGYSKDNGKITTLTLSSSKWVFLANGSYGNVHFTPLWYPDGNYIVRVELSDVWTPAGMIKKEYKSNKIIIKDSAYDDWYVGR